MAETADTTAAPTGEQAEVERLRARVADLERELVEQTERTHAIVAAAQERTYWLERWHIDLNALMRRRGAGEARAAFRLARKVVRGLKRVKRSLTRTP